MPLMINKTTISNNNDLYQCVNQLTKNNCGVTYLNYEDYDHPKDDNFLKVLNHIQNIIDQNPTNNFFIRNDTFLATINVYSDNTDLISKIGFDQIILPNKSIKNQITKEMISEIQQAKSVQKTAIDYISYFRNNMHANESPYCKKLILSHKHSIDSYDFIIELLNNLYIHTHDTFNQTCLIPAHTKRPNLSQVLIDANQ